MPTITVINPNTSDALTGTITAAARSVAPPGVEVVGVHPSRGVGSVESHAEEAWAALGVVEQVQRHDAGSDAFVIACFGDTGLEAARELAAGPVVGMTEAALHSACLVAHRFVVVTLPPRTLAHSERVIRSLGLGHRCTVRTVEAAVAELEGGSEHLLDAFARQARAAAADDDAEAVVLGCAGLADLVEPLREATGMPVVEGVAAAIGAAASLLAQDLRTARGGAYGQISGLPDVSAAWEAARR